MAGDPAIPVFLSIAAIPADFGPSVAAIGNFDGVHLGHRQILSAVAEEARRAGRARGGHHLRSAPGAVPAARACAAALDADARTVAAAAGTGIDAVVVLPFDAALASLSAREFCVRVLVGALGVRGLHEGQIFALGMAPRREWES